MPSARLSSCVTLAIERLCRPYRTASIGKRRRTLAGIAASAVTIGLIGIWIGQNYRIGWDRQVNRCLDYRVFLVSLSERPERIGEIAVFRAQKSNPVFKEGQIVAKRIRAHAGDVVEINPQFQILVNGRMLAQGLPYLKGASTETIRRYIGKRTLREGEYWVMGDSPTSYDSRYWGVLHENQIIGKGYALF